MASVTAKTGSFSVRAHVGDAKTLLAFNLPKGDSKNLAGFTIQCKPGNQPPYYIYNKLQFEKPENHAQVASEPAYSSVNAPIHKFRWLHVPGSFHQGVDPHLGDYQYTVTPRYFDNGGSLLPLDPTKSVTLSVTVAPFAKGSLSLGFTRGFTQSQAFVNHFGLKALIRPKSKELLFDTTAVSGKDAQGKAYTFGEEYDWLGYTAKAQIFSMIQEVVDDKSLSVDVFAYDLNEPDLIRMFLKLAKDGRIQVILDNAALHHDSKASKPEDQFEIEFNKAKAKGAAIIRGKFGRFAHDKIFVVSDANGPRKVLTGSTNFSATGLYVNSNHVIVFDDATVATLYKTLFDNVWKSGATLKAFLADPFSQKVWPFAQGAIPQTEIALSPHAPAAAESLLNGIAQRVKDEGKKANGSVFFAVMQVDGGTSPVWQALVDLHKQEKIYSYGISDTTKGISLYTPGKKNGVLVTGKPASTVLPPPFSQVPDVGLGHQVHHKFVVCGFNTVNPVVYCGSSNLASGGETVNGDNLLAIHDADVATVFVLEAVGLVDHFNFLDKNIGNKVSRQKALANPIQAAKAGGWFLSTTDKWAAPYYDSNDLHCADRVLFG